MLAKSVTEVTEITPRTERGRARRARNVKQLTPLEQIRATPNSAGGSLTGVWAYYINPDGATIRDALVIYPNGGIPPEGTQHRAKYGVNADYYRARQARKGLEYVGTTLTETGVKRLVAVLISNREDEIMDLEDQIAECQLDIENSDRPEVRDNQRKRRDQLQNRLDYVKQELDADALIKELNEIARAQRMSKVSPETLAVMREMLAEQSVEFSNMVARFRTSDVPSDSPLS